MSLNLSVYNKSYTHKKERLSLRRQICLMMALSVAVIFVFDPVGYWGLRNVAFAICLLFGFPFLLFSSPYVSRIPAIFGLTYTVMLPLWGLLGYSILSLDKLTDTSYISFALLMGFAGFFAVDDDQYIARTTVFVTAGLIASITCGSYVYILVTGTMNSLTWLTQGSVAVLAFREYGAVESPYIYVLASPLLILGCCQIMLGSERINPIHLAVFCVLVFSLGLSGTRAHQALAVLIIVMFVYFRVGRMATLILVGIITASGITILAKYLSAAFDLGETSNAIKFSMLNVYGDIFEQPIVMLLGQGFNAHTWSADVKSIVSVEIGATKSELTYLELLRVFGLVGGGFAIIILFLFVTRQQKEKGSIYWLQVGVLLQLLNSSLNPYLFSFNGAFGLAILLGLQWSDSRRE